MKSLPNLVADSESPLPLEGRVGKYHLLGKLGEGGMAEVFLAVTTGPGGFQKLLVLKTLKAELAAEPTIVSMFLEEARLAARMSHPNVVHTYEVVTVGTAHLIVMEYLRGVSLSRMRRRVDREHRLPVELHVIRQALEGLHHAHELRGVDGTQLHLVHRDFTGANLFVTFDGTVKVLDFGVAKVADASIKTRSGMFKGTVGYAAPEVLMGEPLDRRADIYSAGVLLWEALAGRRMWEDMAEAPVMMRVVRGDLPALEEVRPDVPAAAARIVRRATALEPDDRFDTARELAEAIDAWLAEGDVASLGSADVAAEMEGCFGRQRDVVDRRVAQRLAELGEAREPEPLRGRVSGEWARDDESAREDSAPTVLDRPTVDALEPGADSPARTGRPARRRFAVTLVVLSVILGVAGGLFAEHLEAGEEPSAHDGAEPVAAAPSAPGPAEPDHSSTGQDAEIVEWTIQATPPSARIEVEGEPTGANPARLRFDASETPVEVRISAPGHRPRVLSYRPDRDRAVEVQLERETPAPDIRSKARRQTPGGNDGTTPTPGGRAIDERIEWD